MNISKQISVIVLTKLIVYLIFGLEQIKVIVVHIIRDGLNEVECNKEFRFTHYLLIAMKQLILFHLFC